MACFFLVNPAVPAGLFSLLPVARLPHSGAPWTEPCRRTAPTPRPTRQGSPSGFFSWWQAGRPSGLCFLGRVQLRLQGLLFILQPRDFLFQQRDQLLLLIDDRECLAGVRRY